MSVSLSIHAQKYFAKKGDVSFEAGSVMWDNANCLTLSFVSKEEGKNQFGDRVDSKTEVSIFHLSNTDAEILSTIGKLDAEHRAELLPILRHMMEDQKAAEEIAAEEAAEK